ncbi:MAG: hypothetical protein A2X61_09820 [Ignavibacteria bacterium GWB2_35_12]|nr:MAG: hypothetical protein A2X61_09820 [Ignavibacteria bacterium GWB2_35_12]OGU93588.1 MAG: hypothetical protein A2220_03425 [Ignavibacteria bacterium RIFOXYA2_FULL_35_10]OGV23844.1 MAG: hypothetical protein A2475_07015 [Ignavibacteria bacterium RIFOXYC2_FULL_35_21]
MSSTKFIKTVFFFFAFLLTISILSSIQLNAQELQEVVYLKNGSIIRGTIIEQVPGKSLKIQTADGSVFVYQMEEVEKITKEKPVSTNIYSNYQMGNSEFLFNPLGFLQFGPIFEYNFRIGQSFFIGPHFRYSAGGVLYHVVADYTEGLDMTSAAVGISMKNFYGASQDKFYVGGIIEYGWGGGELYNDNNNIQYYSHTYISLSSNIGYRWRYDSGFFLNVGGIIGIAPQLSNDKETETTIIAMAELSFGWEF